MLDENLLEINNLKNYFHTDKGLVKAVDGISYSINKKETLALVGESGCGKSISSLSILGLIPFPGKIEEGKIIFKGKDLTKLKEKELRKYRGKEISMIFQEPMTSLNPVFKVGDQILEALTVHYDMDKKSAKEDAVKLLKKVEIPDAESRYHHYPHQLSGGLRQRVMIAMALICKPSLLIADEPTTALDVTIQKQILYLLDELKQKENMSLLLITHDLGVVCEIADKVAIMYAGKIMEYSDKISLFENPKHPYTQGLLDAVPQAGKKKLKSISGRVPSLLNLPSGCLFHPRCEYAKDKCKKEMPGLSGKEHKVRCFNNHES